ncbi:hypothetical protein AKJ09_00309 [Labilithrix luteola]|uniref:Uncharacterized protein n=2 Tax=Labilithrix luteola TaxID=1391654 RepID=A0A0K1PJE3_9BACT|nr:hypothetical protein AKJ09_00309 [Labilithrix luteola]
MVITGCGQKAEPPSDQGQHLTTAQAASLTQSKTLLGKRVTVEGYPALCSMGHRYRAGDPVSLEVHTEPDCHGPRIVNIDLPAMSAAPGIGGMGPKPRNRLLVETNFDNSNIKFLTDDYQTVPAKTKLSVSGDVAYPIANEEPPFFPTLNAPSLKVASGS